MYQLLWRIRWTIRARRKMRRIFPMMDHRWRKWWGASEPAWHER